MSLCYTKYKENCIQSDIYSSVKITVMPVIKKDLAFC